MKRVLTFKDGNYDTWGDPTYYNTAQSLWLCVDEMQEYFDVGKQFDIHVSDKRPQGNNYYDLTLCEDESLWAIGDESPWVSAVDYWLSRNFPKAKTLYVWVSDTAPCPQCPDDADEIVAMYFFGNNFMCPEHGYFEREN